MPQSNYSSKGNKTRDRVSNHHLEAATANTVTWTQEDQKILEEGLQMHTSGSPAQRYAKIALMLGNNKSIRDVALRVKWMTLIPNSVA